MTLASDGRVICGQPMRFKQVSRDRDDTFPVCHRPPHEGEHHLSESAVRHAREHHKANRHRYRRKMSDPPATVTA